MGSNLNKVIQDAILTALKHDEAEDGLYFSNLFHLHEEDEREAVPGSPEDIERVLRVLVNDGIVTEEGSGDQAIYRIAR